MKNIVSLLKDKAFTEHLDDLQLTLFSDHKLNEAEREEVFKHLSQCQRCREVLKVASELKAQEEALKPINNLNYKGALKRLGVVASIAIVFVLPSQLEQQNKPTFKGVCEEKGIIAESIEYWEKLFDKYFGEDKE